MISPKLSDFEFVFFGTDEFAGAVLAALVAADLKPALIVTTPDQSCGRGQVLTPPPVKFWAETQQIPYQQPKNLRSDLETSLRSDLGIKYQLFLVASYGKIIPPEILALPEHGVLNLHPSLLPEFRGPTPIQSAILAGAAVTGVSLMLVDEEVDHGPILKVQSVKLKTQNFVELRDQLAKLGAQLFIETLPDWLAGKITPQPQDHARATETKKLKKEDGLINLTDDPQLNYRKFLALTPQPGIYCFVNQQRIIIAGAALTAGQFVITRVRPAGRREMTWADFQRGLR